ncbi:MAG: endo-1,4-beta-xylanase [Planctomycetes bacterium]|nr:endo-1,4-beta-xylanase [Planctomycetota bacterium]MBU1517346.1 endo-1,4-beta-xylanase [Planctomycetota bacterium]MBU2597201.1 endo-1,4-beta-xylanase [Planctomycetota bacterium]
MQFQVFKNGKIVNDFTLTGAVLFGADKIPFRGSKYITFKDGVIDCKTRTYEPAGMSLLWPVEGFGEILLNTTRLPERDEPYILNVELARGKLMEIATKREDWGIFEQTNHLDYEAKEVQGLFIEMLENIGDSAKASMVADKCLAKAMLFAEQLTTRHAEMFFSARLKNRGFARSSLGCRIDPARLDEKEYLKGAIELFAHIGLPINWAKIEQEREIYDFAELDHCMDILGRKRLLISAGPLLNFRPEYLPAWLVNGKYDFETIREASYEFVSKVVTRYAKYVHIWQVISGMNAYNHFRFSFERILEITRTACLAAREADNRSLKMIEIVHPWADYYAYNAETIPPLVYVDMVTQGGINYDAVGVQVQFGKDEPGMHVRDMMQISAMLDKFIAIPKPLHITNLAIPDGSGSKKDAPQPGGIWHKPWDQTIWSKWIENFCKIAFSKPFVNTISFATLADDGDTTIAGAGLLTSELKPKKSFMTLAKLQKQILQK